MAQESVSIVEQDQEGDRAMSVVDGFVLEENRTSHSVRARDLHHISFAPHAVPMRGSEAPHMSHPRAVPLTPSFAEEATSVCARRIRKELEALSRVGQGRR